MTTTSKPWVKAKVKITYLLDGEVLRVYHDTAWGATSDLLAEEIASIVDTEQRIARSMMGDVTVHVEVEE